MAIWAIGDLHLSFGTPGKEMGIFGEDWAGHPHNIKEHWLERVQEKDLVLIPGDISWAKTLEGAMPDLEWIDSLPGTKVILRGNHDYWWQAISKLRKALPPSIHAIQHDSFEWNSFSIGGARLWDNFAFNFGAYIPMVENPAANVEEEHNPLEAEKILQRELARLEMSLQSMPKDKIKIAMTHYPPLSADLLPSEASALLEKYGVSACVFGHLHHVHTHLPLFGEKAGIRYILTSADYIRFVPVKIFE